MALTNQWKMQEAAGGTTIADDVAANTATITAGTIAVEAGPGGDFPSGVSFDGAIYFETASAVPGSGAANWSVGVRVKSTAAGFNTILGLKTTTASYFRLESAIKTRLRTDSGSIQQRDVASLGVTWHTYLMTYNTVGTLHRLFLDGVEVSPAFSSSSGLDIDAIGFGNSTGAAANAGTAVCDVRIYDSDESANAAAIHAEADDTIGRDLDVSDRSIRGIDVLGPGDLIIEDIEGNEKTYTFAAFSAAGGAYSRFPYRLKGRFRRVLADTTVSIDDIIAFH